MSKLHAKFDSRLSRKEEREIYIGQSSIRFNSARESSATRLRKFIATINKLCLKGNRWWKSSWKGTIEFYRVEHVGHRCIIIIINFVRKDPCKTFFNSSLDELSNYIFCTSFIRAGMQGIQIKYFPNKKTLESTSIIN